MTDTNAMREALEWYAEQVAGCRKIGSAGDPFRHALDRDGGERARNALALLATDRAAGVGEWRTGVNVPRVEQRHKDAAAWAMDKAPDGLTWNDAMASHVTPDRRWQMNRVAEAMARMEREALSASPPAPADASDFSPHRWTEIISNGLGANNAGCWRCGALSEVLARVLSLSGHDAKVIQGKANGEDHVWVQIGDTVYDPTVGQFQEPVSYQMDQVAPADASGEVERLREAAAKCDPVLRDKPSVKVMAGLLKLGAEHQRPRSKQYARGEHNAEADAEFIVAAINFARAALNPTAGAKP